MWCRWATNHKSSDAPLIRSYGHEDSTVYKIRHNLLWTLQEPCMPRSYVAILHAPRNLRRTLALSPILNNRFLDFWSSIDEIAVIRRYLGRNLMLFDLNDLVLFWCLASWSLFLLLRYLKAYRRSDQVDLRQRDISNLEHPTRIIILFFPLYLI